MLLNISEGSKNKNSRFRTFRKAQKKEFHASERFRRLKKQKFMLLNISEGSKNENSRF